jgi:ABC-type phosphate/phosphonate transport system permease subunit
MPALLSAGPAAVNPYRDPAWRGRVLWTLAALALLGPALVAVDFRLWLFFEPDNLKVTLNFLSSFLPPATAPDFLLMVLRETWRTVAIATAALVLALVLAVPLTLLSTAAVSISSLSGRMHSAAWALRQAVRGLLVLLRSVPELVWALVFVRVLGLGPAAGVLAIALTYAGMLGIDERGGQFDSLPDGLLRAKGRPVATGGDLQVRFESARAWGMSGPSMRCGMSWASMPWGRCSGAPASPPPSSRRSG